MIVHRFPIPLAQWDTLSRAQTEGWATCASRKNSRDGLLDGLDGLLGLSLWNGSASATPNLWMAPVSSCWIDPSTKALNKEVVTTDVMLWHPSHKPKDAFLLMLAWLEANDFKEQMKPLFAEVAGISSSEFDTNLDTVYGHTIHIDSESVFHR